MSFAIASSAALALAGANPSPYALVERWYELDTGDPFPETASPERRTLRAKAEQAVDRARSVAGNGGAINVLDDAHYELPPMVVERTVKVRFRRVAPLPPPTLDENDLPL